MTIRSDITINWGVSPRIIEVAAPSTELTVQDLYDTLRSLGAEAIDEPEIIDGSGKEVLSATEAVGLTVKLLNAKVKFEDRTEPVDCDIYGGNLVALDVNESPMSPIQYAENVTVSYAKSSSATLVQAAEILAIKAKTDHLPSDPAAQSLVQDIRDIIGSPTSPTIADDLDQLETEIVSVKGIGWTDETLKKIKELIEAAQSKASGGGGFSV